MEGTRGSPESARGETTTVVESTPGTPSGVPSPVPTVPRRGEQLGRYIVLEPIGEGGMGTVVAAYDPELDRRVALKLIRPDGAADGDAPVRLVREAQAIAQLSHPNVVSVFDVGRLEDRVFIAMELVEGLTLTSWVRREQRSWRAVLEVLRQAGRGLAAAHAAGLVHRDFKPGNIIVGHDGRVRVLDFGLARAVGHREPSAPDSGGTELLTSPLTQAGAIMGTPAYMAPEQHGGKPVDAAADQFAFCVVAWEALSGERPFAGDTVDERLESVFAERLQTGVRTMPRWVRSALATGLRPHPADRHPSMHHLLRRLDRDPARLVGRAAIVVGLAGAMTAAYAYTQHDATAEVCGGADVALEPVWNDARREKVAERFAASSVAAAPDLLERVEDRLDDWSAAWKRVHREACEATRIRGERSVDLLDRQVMCLDALATDTSALIEVLETGGDDVVLRSVRAVAGLAEPSTCANLAALGALAPLPRDRISRQQLESLNHDLSRARALRRSGQHAEARALAPELVEAALVVGYAPAEAEARTIAGQLLSDAGDFEPAETMLVRAVTAADVGQDDLVRAEALAILAFVRGHQQGDPAEGLRILDQARAALERSGGSEKHHAYILLTRGIVEDAAGHHVQALQHYDNALAVATEALGEEHPVTLAVLSNMSVTLGIAGQIERAIDSQMRLLALQKRVFGDSHPELVGTLTNIGSSHGRRRDHETALKWHERALALADRVLPSEGPQHVEALGNLGGTLTELERWDEARDKLERARKILTDGDPGDYRVLYIDAALAQLERASGNHEAARPALTELVTRGERQYGPDHPFVAQVLVALGNAHLDASAPEQAREALERALAIYTGMGAPPPTGLAAAEFGLARAQMEAGAAEEPARKLAARSRARLEALGPTTAEEVAEIDAWLREHGGPLRPEEADVAISLKPPAG